jgi:hypothetical protein
MKTKWQHLVKPLGRVLGFLPFSFGNNVTALVGQIP